MNNFVSIRIYVQNEQNEVQGSFMFKFFTLLKARIKVPKFHKKASKSLNNMTLSLSKNGWPMSSAYCISKLYM